jgi:hypothetical protein
MKHSLWGPSPDRRRLYVAVLARHLRVANIDLTVPSIV